MTHNRNRSRKRMKRCLLVAAAACALSGFAYEVSIGNATVQPGGSVQLPVLLDDAADVAVVKFQINYDPQLLTLSGVTNRPSTLGASFALDYENDDGVLVVILYREISLVSGSGELASLQFTANSGAEISMESALTLAEASLGDQVGRDLSWASPVSVADGLVQIRSFAMTDSDGDGIPDSWEEFHFGGSTNANPNEICANGINTVREAYIAGLDPNDPQSVLLAAPPSNNGKVLQWNAASGRVYSVYFSTNLMSGFQCLESNIPWTRASFTNSATEPSGFYIIDVRLAE